MPSTNDADLYAFTSADVDQGWTGLRPGDIVTFTPSPTATLGKGAAKVRVISARTRGRVEDERGPVEDARGPVEDARGADEDARGAVEDARGAVEDAWPGAHHSEPLCVSSFRRLRTHGPGPG